MRRFSCINVLTLLAMLLWAAQALAIDLAPGFNTLEYLYWENRVGVTGSGGPIQVGDQFYGVAQVQVIRGSTPGSVNPFDTSSNPVHNLTGYFYNQVVSVGPAQDPENAIIILGTPTASDPNGVISDAERAAGVVFKLFEDFGTNPNLSTVPLSVSSMTDGNLWMSLSIDNGYWWSEALLNPTGTLPGTFLGFSWIGLNTVFSSVPGLMNINDPREDLFNSNVKLYSDATIETNARRDGSFGVWAFTGDDPATVATPEPATMMIMGSGLLAMFGARRRKKNA